MGAEASTEPRSIAPDGPAATRGGGSEPLRYGLAVLRFAAAKGMLTPEYARLALRFLRHRLLTVAGWRWATDGMLFLGPRLQRELRSAAATAPRWRAHSCATSRRRRT